MTEKDRSTRAECAFFLLSQCPRDSAQIEPSRRSCVRAVARERIVSLCADCNVVSGALLAY